MNDDEHAEVLVTSGLLGAAWPASLLIAAGSALAAAMFAARIGNAAVAGCAFLLGLAGVYFSFRVAFDAALLRDAAARRWSGADVDARLVALGLRDQPAAARTWHERCRGAARLLRMQISVLALQFAGLAAAGLLPR